jgi:hypothetical protein
MVQRIPISNGRKINKTNLHGKEVKSGRKC